MIEIAPDPTPSRRFACFDVKQLRQGDISILAVDGEIKAPTAVVRLWLGEKGLRSIARAGLSALSAKFQANQSPWSCRPPRTFGKPRESA